MKKIEYDGKPAFDLNPLQLKMKQQIENKIKEGIYKFEKVPCCICGGDNFEILSEKDRYGLPLNIVICKDCGLMYMNPRMDQKSYTEFYNEEYWGLVSSLQISMPDYFNFEYVEGEDIINILEGMDYLKETSYILEVGCGVGGLLYRLSAKGYDVVGVDLRKSCIEVGRTVGLDLTVGTIKDLRLKKAPDIILYPDVFEHLLYPNAELFTLSHLMADDGIICIKAPGVKWLEHNTGYRKEFLRMIQIPHTYYFTLDTLTNLLGLNRFELIGGNERILAFFRKGCIFNTEIVNDYEKTLLYLKNLEERNKYENKKNSIRSLRK